MRGCEAGRLDFTGKGVGGRKLDNTPLIMSWVQWRPLFGIPALEDLAIPAVCSLILFLAYTSQYLFYYIDPGPLTRDQVICFNILVFAIWVCYDSACTVDPGRRGWVRKVVDSEESEDEDDEGEGKLKKGKRWCKKCDAVKPPRAHHCKKCERYASSLIDAAIYYINDKYRCIPKMDHHCPWTSNCVSLTTFPHFIRFVLYAVLSMTLLSYHLLQRVLPIWNNRNLPAYLGPPTWAMAHLFVLCIVNGITLFALFILLTRAVYSLATNTTMIESWEIERHDALIERSRRMGGYVYANGGQKMRVERQEFPYDIGIWKNLCQGMGSSNPLVWLFPWGGAPDIRTAGNYEVNGFENPGKSWPPPDPEKMSRASRPEDVGEPTIYGSPEEEMEAFKRRQKKDYERFGGEAADEGEEEGDDDEYESEYEEGMDGEEGWTNSDGDRLRDFGVDEDAEIVADDDIPLGELLRRRKARPIET